MLIKVLTAMMLFLSTAPTLLYDETKNSKPVITPKAQVEKEEEAKLDAMAKKIKPIIEEMALTIDNYIQDAKSKKKIQFQVDIKDVEFNKKLNDCSLEFKVEIIILIKYFKRCGYDVSAQMKKKDTIELTINWDPKRSNNV
jgi:hypothetical protein